MTEQKRLSVTSVTSHISHRESVNQDKNRDADGQLIRPANLAVLSEEDYLKLGKRATFKMDLVIMPCVTIMYILNYLDRQNIASARLADIEKDLNLTDVNYQTAVSILFVGYSKCPRHDF